MNMITDYIGVEENDHTGGIYVVHTPSKTVLKKHASPVGLGFGASSHMEEYAINISKLAVDWEHDKIEEVFPFELKDVVIRYLDPVGYGEKTVGEVSAMIMERYIRESV